MKKKLFLNILVTVGLLLIIAVNFIFLKEVWRYGHIAGEIHSIEENGNCIINTKDGVKKGWDVYPELITKYNEMQEKKSELINSSDVIKWIAASAETITGQVIRLMSIIVSVTLLVLAVYTLIRVLLQDMGYLIKILRID